MPISSPTFHALVCAIGLSATTLSAAEPTGPGTTQVSVASSGAFADARSGAGYGHSVSADGRFVVFTSFASNLTTDVSETHPWQVYVHDRRTGKTRLVSRNLCGLPAVDGAAAASAHISANGRFVVFNSRSADLVAGDTNERADVFRHDLRTGKTILISKSSAGVQSNDDIYSAATISDDGNLVAFPATSTNLVAGATSYAMRVYARNVALGQTSLVSVDSQGQPVNNSSSIALVSGDGTHIAFYGLLSASNPLSYATYVRDVVHGTTTAAGVNSAGIPANDKTEPCDISYNGNLVLFGSPATNLVAGDTNGVADLFVRDISAGKTTRVNLGSGGVQANQETLALATLSGDGKFVAFSSSATNLVPGDTNGLSDIFVRNLQSGVIRCASVHSDGSPAHGDSSGPSLSADGSTTIFTSYDTTLGGNVSIPFNYQVFANQVSASPAGCHSAATFPHGNG